MIGLPHNIQDPIWGQIGFGEEEWKLIDTAALQRLRRIHQLALTLLVFPGATHSRFEHSIGACHAAGLIASRLTRKATTDVAFGDDELRLVRLAALVHDIGHGPFSHVSDDFFGDKGHEKLGSMMLMNDPAIRDLVGEDTARRLGSMMIGERPRTVVADVVSGPTDADKVDYLLRDSHYAGVTQGQFDHQYFLDQVDIFYSNPDSFLGFGWKGVWAVEGMVLARHHMHRTVYGHPKRLITDLMLQRGIKFLNEEEVLPDVLVTPPDESRYDETREALHRWTDWTIVDIGLSQPDCSRARKMFLRLTSHDLLKLVVHVEGWSLHQRLGEEASKVLSGLKRKELNAVASTCESDIAGIMGTDPDLVFVRIEDPDNPLVHPDAPADASKLVPIRTLDGETSSLADESEILSGTESPRPWHRLYVYGLPDTAQLVRADLEARTALEDQAIRRLAAALEART